MSELIEHNGTIIEVSNSMVIVRILSTSMCASCHSKGACNMNDSKEKDIEVKLNDTSSYKVGDKVIVCLEQKIGTKAVLIGFFFPFLVLLFTVTISNLYIFPNNEVFSALSSILAVAIYYFIIYLLRNKIEKDFHFQIK